MVWFYYSRLIFYIYYTTENSISYFPKITRNGSNIEGSRFAFESFSSSYVYNEFNITIKQASNI